jgi:hypothetical protein
MRVERRLIHPELEQDECVGIEDTLEHFVLQAARFLLHGAAAVSHSPGELGALAGLGIGGNDETDGHVPFLSYHA